MYSVAPWSDDVAAAIGALPASAISAFAELRAALELSPWTVGEPFSRSTPDGPTRTAIIGPDRNVMITFGIRESDARAVTIVQVTIF